MEPRYKYPRTLHLPHSQGTSDDLVLDHLNHFEGEQVVGTIKMDGQNTTLYPDHIHARSTTSAHHPSQELIKSWWAKFAYKIPQGIRICGENLTAVHNIKYTNLPTYFMVISIWEGNTCLSWADTLYLCKELDLETVPVFYWAKFNLAQIEQEYKQFNLYPKEGYVIRNSDEFEYDQFSNNVAKFVEPEFKQNMSQGERSHHFQKNELSPDSNFNY